jgi:glycosyltransferase involved in cell wall biosynthesis
VLKKFYKRNVIFDIHENFLGQIKSRNYGIKTPLIHLIAKLLNKSATKNLNLLLAEDSYAKEYKGMDANYEIIHNFPDHTLLSSYATTERSTKRDIFYVGLISRDRNIINILKSLITLKETVKDFHFHCIGPIIDGLEDEFSEIKDYEKIRDSITFYGRIDLEKAYEISMKCRFGLAILKPTPNYLESYPTKIFEYYCVGLPVVSSNFKIYEEIVGKYNGGIMVNPLNPQEIADSYIAFYNNNEINEVSKNLINNVSKQFNWEHEAKKLESFYYSLI